MDYFTRGNHFNKQLPTSCVCRCWGIARDLAVEWTIESAIAMNRRENVNRQCTRLASRLAIRKSSLLIDHCSTRSERITRSAEFRSGGSIIMQSRYAIVAPRAHCCQCSHGECRIPTQWHCLLTAEQDTPILCRTPFMQPKAEGGANYSRIASLCSFLTACEYCVCVVENFRAITRRYGDW